MSEPIRNWIVAQLNAVSNVGRVHPYQRYAAREKPLADLYSDNGQLRGWFVHRQFAAIWRWMMNSNQNFSLMRCWMAFVRCFGWMKVLAILSLTTNR
jgi:hypothetical protein